MMSVWTKFCSSLRAFRIARGGNVAITFAIATLPIVTFVGFAVDYSHANSVKVALQSALDSTALMLSKEAATDTSAQLQANAVKYFNALFTRPEAKNITVSANYTTSGGTALVVNGLCQCAHLLSRPHPGTKLPEPGGERFVHRQVGHPTCCAWRWCSTTPDRWPTTAR